MSPGKGSQKSKERYWLLKSSDKLEQTIIVDGQNEVIEPVFEQECDAETYEKSPLLNETITQLQLEDIELPFALHGRRKNDNVELFRRRGNRETSGLREELESLGLNVRSCVIRVETSPDGKSYRFVKETKSDAKVTDGSKSHTTRCGEAVDHAIAELEAANNCKVEYGIVADATVDAGKETLAILRTSQEVYESVGGPDEQIALTKSGDTLQGQESTIIGVVRDGKATFLCSEDEMTKFFNREARVKRLRWFDGVEPERKSTNAKRNAAKKRKEKQKRADLRRQVELDRRSDELFVHQDEDDNPVKRRIEKERERKKARQARKKQSSTVTTLTVEALAALATLRLREFKEGDGHSEPGAAQEDEYEGADVVNVSELNGPWTIRYFLGDKALTTNPNGTKRVLHTGSARDLIEELMTLDFKDEHEERWFIANVPEKPDQRLEEDESDDDGSEHSEKVAKEEGANDEVRKLLQKLRILFVDTVDDFQKVSRLMQEGQPLLVARPMDN